MVIDDLRIKIEDSKFEESGVEYCGICGIP
jgi:hypothetical protein